MKYFILPALIFFMSCSSIKPIPTVSYVDLEKFMGKWYVIANIPTFIEKGAINATETYSLVADNKIDTVFEFQKDGADGEVKRYNPTGYVSDDGSNATWGMQFIWPIKAEFKIVFLSPDYKRTIIGRSKRDYIWLMAKEPTISSKEMEEMLNKAKSLGYDLEKIRTVPQISGK